MRKFSLGQDRYARQYWVLPSLGGVIVEGVETSLDRTLQPDFHDAEEEATSLIQVTDPENQHTTAETKQEICETVSGDTKNEVDVVEKIPSSENEDGAGLKIAADTPCDGQASKGTDASEKNGGLSNLTAENASGKSQKDEEMETEPSLQCSQQSTTIVGPDNAAASESQISEERVNISTSAVSLNSRPVEDKHVVVVDDSNVGSHELITPHRPKQTAIIKSGPRSFDEELSDDSRRHDVTDAVASNQISASRMEESVHSIASHDHSRGIESTTHVPESKERASVERKFHDDRVKNVESREVIVELGSVARGSSLSCQESLLEEEEAERNAKMAAATTQLAPPTAAQEAATGGSHVPVGEIQSAEHKQPHKQRHHSPLVQQPHFSSPTAEETSSTTQQIALASSAAAIQSAFYSTPPSAPSPWFSLYPRDVCESVQVAYINNQAVLVETNTAAQQPTQQQQVQHVLATDAAGHQYIMATPTPSAPSPANAAATATPQYAYMTPDGQIIAASPAAPAPNTGGNQVIQQVTGMSYALMGNTLVQVPQTQYIAVNASGQQFMIQGPPGGGQAATNQQAGVQYVAVNGGNNASSANMAALQTAATATGQQGQGYVAVVEREGGGQMLVQVGSAEQQVQVPMAGATPTQQYIVQTMGDPSTLVTTATAQTRQQQGEAMPSTTPPQGARYGIVNSDGSITLIGEETVASYGAAQVDTGSAVVQAHTATAATVAGVQQSSSSTSVGGRSLGEGDERVKGEIEIPDQYPQVYVKTEPEEEEKEEESEEIGRSLASRQTAVVVLDQPSDSQGGAGQSSSLAVKEDSSNDDGTNQQVAATEVTYYTHCT